MDSKFYIWFFLVLALVTFALFKVFGKYITPKKFTDEDSEDKQEYDDLKQRFSKTELLFRAIYIILWLVISVTLLFAFKVIANIANIRFDNPLFVFTPNFWYWCIPSFFLAVIIGVYPLDLITKKILKADYSEFMRFYRVKYGYNEDDSRTFLKKLLSVTVILIFIYTVIGLNCYAVFNQNGIKVNTWLSMNEKNYPYNSIKEIYNVEKVRAPNGNINPRPKILVKFDNGESWNSSEDIWEKEHSYSVEVAKFISEKSGIPIKNVELLN